MTINIAGPSGDLLFYKSFKGKEPALEEGFHEDKISRINKAKIDLYSLYSEFFKQLTNDEINKLLKKTNSSIVKKSAKTILKKRKNKKK